MISSERTSRIGRSVRGVARVASLACACFSLSCAASAVDEYRRAIEHCGGAPCYSAREAWEAPTLSVEERRELAGYACDRGDGPSCFRLSAATVEAQPTESLSWLEKGCRIEPEECLYFSFGGRPAIWFDEPSVDTRLARIRFAAASGKPFGSATLSDLVFGTLEPTFAGDGLQRGGLAELVGEAKTLCSNGYQAYCPFASEAESEAVVSTCSEQGASCWVAGVVLRKGAEANEQELRRAADVLTTVCTGPRPQACADFFSGWTKAASGPGKELPAKAMVIACRSSALSQSESCDAVVVLTPAEALDRCLHVRVQECVRRSADIQKALEGEWSPECDKGASFECQQGLLAISSELAWRKAARVRGGCKLGDPACIAGKAAAFARGEKAWLEVYLGALPAGSFAFSWKTAPSGAEPPQEAPDVEVTTAACTALPSTWQSHCGEFRQGVALRKVSSLKPVPAQCLQQGRKATSGTTPHTERREVVTSRNDVQGQPVRDPVTQAVVDIPSWTVETVQTQECEVRGKPGDEEAFVRACRACIAQSKAVAPELCESVGQGFRTTCSGGATSTRETRH